MWGGGTGRVGGVYLCRLERQHLKWARRGVRNIKASGMRRCARKSISAAKHCCRSAGEFICFSLSLPLPGCAVFTSAAVTTAASAKLLFINQLFLSSKHDLPGFYLIALWLCLMWFRATGSNSSNVMQSECNQRNAMPFFTFTHTYTQLIII